MTWTEILVALQLEWCLECDIYYNEHEHGMLTGRTMHWRKRRITKPGIYKLLHKIAVTRGYQYEMFPMWRRVFLVNQDVLLMTREIGVRLPRNVADYDRARLRFALGEYSEAERRRMTPSEQTDFRAALRWAARS